MTPNPPPQMEYIITVSDLRCLVKGKKNLRDKIAEEICSRPAPSQLQSPCKDIGYCDTCENVNCKHSTVSMATIRNATISDLYDRIKAERDPSLEYVDWDSIEAVFIRTPKEQP